MKFAEALEIIMHGGRVFRAGWHSHPSYGLSAERAGSGNYLALGYVGHAVSATTIPWRTASIDVLQDDWLECEVQAEKPRAYKDD